MDHRVWKDSQGDPSGKTGQVGLKLIDSWGSDWGNLKGLETRDEVF